MAGLLRKIVRAVTAKPAAPPLQAGSQAPPFSVPDHQGHTVRLEDLRGRKVVLWFFPKADTPGCTAQGCALRDHVREFESRGVVILGASFDDQAANRAFAEKFAFPFPLLCDTDRKLGLAYRACTDASAGHPRRMTYLIDERGVISHVLPDVDPGTHADRVLSMLG
jgi:peroxiredoxin Q/BCP